MYMSLLKEDSDPQNDEEEGLDLNLRQRGADRLLESFQPWLAESPLAVITATPKKVQVPKYNPEGPDSQYFWTLVPKAMNVMDFKTSCVWVAVKEPDLSDHNMDIR